MKPGFRDSGVGDGHRLAGTLSCDRVTGSFFARSKARGAGNAIEYNSGPITDHRASTRAQVECCPSAS